MLSILICSLSELNVERIIASVLDCSVLCPFFSRPLFPSIPKNKIEIGSLEGSTLDSRMFDFLEESPSLKEFSKAP